MTDRWLPSVARWLPSTDRWLPSADRAQSNVVGVALLLGVTVLALGALTAGIGTTIEDNAASADATRVADGFGNLEPVETTGVDRVRLSTSGGNLRVEPRELRVLGTADVHTVSVDALVYERGGRRVTFLAGAIVRSRGSGTASLVRAPPITASRGSGGVLVVGAPRLNASGADGVAGEGQLEVTLRTDVSHDRTDLGEDRYRVAVETDTPEAWVEAFERRGAEVVATDRDFDGDGTTSVVARFPGRRTAYLVVHDMALEVN